MHVTTFAHLHEELDEIFLIPLPYTIVDPGTVMVHPSDAVFADPTVMRSGRSVHLTPTHNTTGITQGDLLGRLLGADGPVLLGRHAAPITVTVGEVYPVTGQRNNTRI